MKKLAILVAIGAALDVAVFIFVVVLALSQATANAKSHCWDGVLDQAVTHHGPVGPGLRAHLISAADRCARLPG